LQPTAQGIILQKIEGASAPRLSGKSLGGPPMRLGAGMRGYQLWVATVGSCATIFLLGFGVVEVPASECIVTGEVVLTSQVAVQVFSRRPLVPLEGAAVSLAWEHGSGDPAATGKTDSQGHLQVLGIPPGRYRIRVTLPGYGSPALTNSPGPIWSTQANVRVVPSTDSPARLIAIDLEGGMTCSTYCTVTGTVGPLARAPTCLIRRARR
jgi:hypothetical protein